MQEEHEYFVRVFARNEVGASDPLELEDPIKIIRPDGKCIRSSCVFLSHILKGLLLFLSNSNWICCFTFKYFYCNYFV